MPLMTAEPRHAAKREHAKLTMHDYCDRCGHSDGAAISRAYVRVAKDDMVLDLCAHDFSALEPALMGAGFLVVEDIRATINQKPMSGYADV